MPEKWYNWITTRIKTAKNGAERKECYFNRKLLADKKPYFMQYIYPSERKRLMDYEKRNNEKCIMRFRITLDELKQKKDLTKE